jgi:ASC-1-like (ASCH) protein
VEWPDFTASGAHEQNPPKLLWIKDEFFPYLESGKKTCELRIGYRSFLRLKSGDTLEFKSPRNDKGVKVGVKEVRRYPTFESMTATENIWKIAPNVRSVDEAEAIFKRIFHENEVKKHGLIVIEFEKI